MVEHPGQTELRGDQGPSRKAGSVSMEEHFNSPYSGLQSPGGQPVPLLHCKSPGLMKFSGGGAGVVAQSRPTLCDPVDCVAHQAPLSMGFSRQEYWSGLPFPSPGDLPDLGIEPRSPALQADALTSEPPGKP